MTVNRFLIGVSLAVLALPTFALAEAREGVTDVSQVTVTGTRAKPRTALESLEPIDVISRDTIDQTGSAELVDTLASLVPSFDVQSLPALDATIFVRPARLRNLSPDQTLVLLNGKRVHRSAMMMNPSYGNSFQAPDLDQIANSALSSIDVLRDGAAAQYGSDAIAGVINLNLDASAGFRGFAQYGQYKEGDGEGPRVGAHAGFRSGTTFLALTAEYVNTGATSRSQAGSNQLASQAAYPNLTFPNPAVKWGLPSREATRVAMTAGTDVMGVSLYTFGTWGQGKGVGDFNYRGPKGSYASVFNTNAAFPGWNLLTLYPTGFTPHFGSRDHDVNLIAGAKKTFANGAKLDFSVDYGRNDISYFMTNSINASLGPNSPTAFNDGAVQQTELSYTLDGSIPVALPLLARSATLAAGVEQRTEHFGISAGEPASYAFGPAAPALACCSSGFPGYAPVSAGKWSQDSSAAYLDLDLPFSRDWSVDAAVRYEDFNTFGSSTTWKLSSRYELTPGVAIRGTMGTGFRAPTPAQLYSEGLSQFLPSATASITTTGRFSPVGPVAQVLNQRAGVSIQPLRPETSRNFSVGMVFQTSFGLQTTVDLYRIEIAHRLNTSTSYVLTTAENATLTALKIPNLQGIYSANFLQNDFNTANQGVDIVSVYTRPVGPGVLSLTGAASFLDTEVTGGSRAVNPYSKKMYENSLPRYRATFSSSYTVGPLELTGRARYYGRWSDFTDTFPATAAPGAAYPTYAPQTFGSVIFCDLIANYRVTQNITVRAGAENAFDKYPDKARYQTFRGLIYSRNTPYSTDGAYYYARIDFKY
jgi:iron complex outermembrane receptor protein